MPLAIRGDPAGDAGTDQRGLELNCTQSSGFSRKTSAMRVAGRQHFRSPLALFCAAGLSLLVLCAPIYAQARRTINLDDLARMRDVRDPQCSPDGKWVAYTVSTIDVKADKHNSHVWMVSADGAKDIQVTESQESESGPQWSPDGKYLAFTS
ncbi:MAG TPA: hypothetical protein VII66_02840, partial [Gemmatimonadaceae bacterium]